MTGERNPDRGKRPLLKALLVAGAVAILAISARFWLPPLLTFAGANADTLQGLTSAVQLALWVGIALLFIFMWIRSGVSLRELLSVGSESGSTLSVGERGVNVEGGLRAPVTTGDHNSVEVTHGDRITVEADEELYRRLLGSETVAPAAVALPAPQVFTGRDRELSAARARLIGSGGTAREDTVVVTGIPGMGKTALATVAAADDGVREAFPDGTSWVTIGPSPDVVGELGGLARSLGATDDARPRNLTEAQARVASLLAEKRILLVVDDVYGVADAAAFRPSGGRCATLLTTRDREVARQLAPGRAGPLVLEELSEEDSLELLARLAPEVVERHRSRVEALVRELGGLPLAIRVAGGLLAAEESMGWGVEDLLGELREGRKVLESEVPADRLPVPEGASPTVAALLRASLDRLSPEVGGRFRLLGAFPSKPVSFDLFAAAKVWGMAEPDDARSTVRELVDRGLLEAAGSGRFYLHAVLASYARLLLETEEEGPDLRDARLKHATHYEQLLGALGHFYRQGGRSMIRALEIFDRERPHFEADQRWAEDRYGEDPEAARVLSGYGSAAPRLVLQKLRPSERRRWLENAFYAAEALGDAEARHKHEAILATAYLDTRETERGFEILERHLRDARAAEDREAEMNALGNLGNAHGDRYELVEAEECYREVLEIARELGDEQSEAQSLGALGRAHDSRGESRQAIRMFRRRLALARQTGGRRSEARALKDLGSSCRQAGRPRRASVLLRKSVQMFDDQVDRYEQGEALNSLGAALVDDGDVAGAKYCFERARVLGREEENPSLEAFAVGNLGNIAGEIERDQDRALELYEEQREIARRARDKTNQATANWNIAVAHWRDDRVPEAVLYGREALRLYEETGDDRAAEEVGEWIYQWESQGSSS